VAPLLILGPANDLDDQPMKGGKRARRGRLVAIDLPTDPLGQIPGRLGALLLLLVAAPKVLIFVGFDDLVDDIVE
jgi:hypothetical protein